MSEQLQWSSLDFAATRARRVRVARGVYCCINSSGERRYEIGWMERGRWRWRMVNGDLADARKARLLVLKRNPRYRGAIIREHTGGVVYFVLAHERKMSGCVKIGKTLDLEKRIRDLEREFGRLELLHTVDGYSDMEGDTHWRFADSRIGRTEWFRREGALAEFLAQL